MQTKEMPKKNSKSFLDKFEGKKNIVSREGLLHLLDLKKQSLGIFMFYCLENKKIYSSQDYNSPVRNPQNDKITSNQTDRNTKLQDSPSFLKREKKELSV
jgi:hypothetical protein